MTRLDLVLALGRAALREPAGAHADEARRLLSDLLDTREARLRPAAPPARRLDLLPHAVRDPRLALWRHSGTVKTGVQVSATGPPGSSPDRPAASPSTCSRTIPTTNSGSTPRPRPARTCHDRATVPRTGARAPVA
ncbi:hypothetical protein ABZV75_28860 [Streptomyces flaveolus]|uniref:hypothetical protein n=1 Tax=Streptomyces flaveolus TaxID=67297 RepID=UPI0033AEFCAB